ncbi:MULTISPECIES: hypothetical protein [Chryseobacterium]|jgi:hypothetical protein|uniref:hypothetical protein n=1 Tax=Chryseobacterium TaxID=59732 RepID=UPI0028967F1E|nr:MULTISPECIES: hypothetical protein [Chryseobacterium]MEC5172116.1 hypothetical protein [Chryseobacterium nepalense]
MENFDDEFGDLSGYKILSFEEVTQGFEGNKNPLGEMKKSRTFQEITNDIALNTPFGNNSMFYKEQREIIIGQIPKL